MSLLPLNYYRVRAMHTTLIDSILDTSGLRKNLVQYDGMILLKAIYRRGQ